MKRVVLGFSLALSVLLSAPAAQALQLNDIVAAFDRAEGDFRFPFRVIAHSGELYLDPINIVISPNCASHIRFSKNQVFCLPNGDASKAFPFADIVKSHPESDSSWVALFLKYDSQRVKFVARLSKRTNEPIYYLLIR